MYLARGAMAAPEEEPPVEPPFFDPAACWDAPRDADDAAPSLIIVVVAAFGLEGIMRRGPLCCYDIFSPLIFYWGR